MYKKSMGKVLRNALCIGLAAAMITGCGTAKAEDGAAEAVTEEAVAEESTEVASSEELAEEAPEAEPESEQESEQETEPETDPISDTDEDDNNEEANTSFYGNIEVKPYTLEHESDNKVDICNDDFGFTASHIFCVDTEGKTIGKYSKEDIATILDEHDTFYYPTEFLFEKDGILYYECRQEYAYPSWSQEAIFAIDPVNSDVAKIVEFEDVVGKFDYYDCSFYLERWNESKGATEVYKIDKSADKLAYSAEVCETIDKYCARTLKHNDRDCYKRILGENGYVVLDKGTGYYVRDINGKETRLGENFIGHLALLTYAPQFVFYAMQESTYHIYDVYMYDVEAGRTYKLPIDTTNLAYDVIYQNGILYYTTIDSKEQGTYTLYSYNVETGEIQILAKDQAGHFSRSYGPLCYDIIENGKIFMKERKDDTVNWYFADLRDIEGTKTHLDFEAVLDAFPAKEDPIAKYGKVETIKGEARCPHCNQVYYSVVADAFVLDPAYSKQADKINAVLMERAKQRTAINGSKNDISKEACQNMHGTAMYTNTDYYNVYEVHIVNDRYLAVSEGVEFRPTDAPSGWENRQFLFNLQTGSELNIMSFYPGTEDDLKKLLANKVVEHFKERYGEVSKPFSAENAETTYNRAYELAKIDAIFFNDDGIMCYFDNDFRDSPYMTDYFRIRVSYQELLGRDSL